ncbi:hypothetical protein R1flu_001688 [Riccia fluitans]|uniref:Uncharacterized protein n=1 Tax=Riccia fluitans TaxID=41844 RepID=A0ABD1Y475_9MARC
MAYTLNRLLFLCTLLFSVCLVFLKGESKYVKEVNTRLVINTSRIVATVDIHHFLILRTRNCKCSRRPGTIHDQNWRNTAGSDGIRCWGSSFKVSVAFGLNALYGRSKSTSQYEVVNPWDPRNAENFIRYTRERAYPVIAWGLGNELLSSGIGKTVSPELYAADVKNLRNIIDKFYDDSKPSVVAPDSFYEKGRKDIPRFLEASGQGVVDVVTRHIYNLGPGVTETNELIRNVLSRSYAENEVVNYESLRSDLKEHPKTTIWIGEAGGAYNSGHHEVTDAFIFAFWYLDQLGTASRYNNQAFCRELCWRLLWPRRFRLQPESGLLWLMGREVFVVDIHDETNDVRAYAHCQKNNKDGVTLLLLNYSNSTRHQLDLSLLGYSPDSLPRNFTKLIMKKKYQKDEYITSSEPSSGNVRLEYHMSAADGTMTGRIVLLNGQPLLVTPSGKIPTLSLVMANLTSPVSLAPFTYAYVVIPNANAPACAAYESSRRRMTT